MANGTDALLANSTGCYNTSSGYAALYLNTTGRFNTVNGAYALSGLGPDTNNTGDYNTATGYQALLSNTTGDGNTASGSNALYSNTTGIQNTASGVNALNRNTTGNNNTAAGQACLGNNTTGSSNTADGFAALRNNTAGSSNIALGSNAGANLTTGNNNIDIGHGGLAGEVATIRIGLPNVHSAAYVAGIHNQIVANGVGVIINGSGKLGTMQSSARYKEAIKPMEYVSEALLKLKPVTFRYKQELDPENVPQFGLIAEDVEKVNPDLVVRDENGKVISVRYDAVNAMLLNEFLKEHRTVQELKMTVVQQQKQIEALTAGLQKVSAQLELNKRAPETVSNNQ